MSSLDLNGENDNHQIRKQKTFIFDKAFENIDEVMNEEDSNSISSRSDNQNIFLSINDSKNNKKVSLRKIMQNKEIRKI